MTTTASSSSPSIFTNILGVKERKREKKGRKSERETKRENKERKRMWDVYKNDKKEKLTVMRGEWVGCHVRTVQL